MCTTDRHDGSCPTCETDEWVVPSGLTNLIRVHDTDVTLGRGRMCGYGHPLRGSASAHGEWWCHPSCDCHPDCYRAATASKSGPLAPERPENAHAPALTRDGFSAALRALGRDGGERVCVECDEPVDSQGTTTGECPGGSGDKCDECFACSCDGSC